MQRQISRSNPCFMVSQTSVQTPYLKGVHARAHTHTILYNNNNNNNNAFLNQSRAILCKLREEARYCVWRGCNCKAEKFKWHLSWRQAVQRFFLMAKTNAHPLLKKPVAQHNHTGLPILINITAKHTHHHRRTHPKLSKKTFKCKGKSRCTPEVIDYIH